MYHRHTTFHKSGLVPSSIVLLHIVYLVCTTLTGISANGSIMLADDSGYSVQCGVCDSARCPELNYCEGKAIKDSCNCCTVCSSPKYQPHVNVVGENECGKVNCPKFQVCVANMQGLPLCKCPSEFLCRSNRKRSICGTDGVTYESKCHMRIASCKQGMMVRKKHRGVCSADDERDGEAFKRKMRRRMRRRRRRRQKTEVSTTTEEASAVGSKVGTENDKGTKGSMATSFGPGSDVFGSRGRDGRLEQRVSKDVGVGISSGNKERDEKKKARLKRRRKRKRKQQRKTRKGMKKDKKERRRRRKKRQHSKPKSRSKRHRYTRQRDDKQARERAFEEVFGHNTWWA